MKRLLQVLVVVFVVGGIIFAVTQSESGATREILVMKDYYKSGLKIEMSKIKVKVAGFGLGVRQDGKDGALLKISNGVATIFAPNEYEMKLWKKWLDDPNAHLQPAIPEVIRE